MKNKSNNFRIAYWLYIFSIIFCYTINNNVDKPLQWHEIALAPILLALCLFVLYMLLIFMKGALNSIKELLSQPKEKEYDT